MSDLREAFEAWAGSFEHDSDTWEDLGRDEIFAAGYNTALQSQTAPALPEGWKLVPVEPTGEMQAAGAKAIRFNTTDINKLWTGNSVYSAMLAAAPQPDHSPDGGKVVQGKNRYGLDMGYFSRLIAREFGDLSNFRPDEFARVCARMAATADASVLQEKEFRVTPAADGGEVELLPSVREYLQQGIDDATHCEDADQDHAFAKQLHDILNRPTPAADGGEVEPADDSSTVYRIGDLGNQIHNLGCSHQNNEELADSLAELAHQAWVLQRDVMRERTATHPAPVAVPEGWRVRVEDGDSYRVSSPGDNHCIIRRELRAPDHYPLNIVYDLLSSMLSAAPQPAHSPDAGKVEPFTYCYTDVNGKAKELCHPPECAAEGDMRVITELYTRPAQPRNEEIAADFEAWLSQVRYMEGLSAHDIIESAEDYITLLRSNGGDV